MSAQGSDEDASAMIDPAIAADSQAQAATTVAAMSSVAAYHYANSMDPPDFHMGRGALNPYASTPFPLPVHSAVAALHPQLYQPSSPSRTSREASTVVHATAVNPSRATAAILAAAASPPSGRREPTISTERGKPLRSPTLLMPRYGKASILPNCLRPATLLLPPRARPHVRQPVCSLPSASPLPRP